MPHSSRGSEELYFFQDLRLSGVSNSGITPHTLSVNDRKAIFAVTSAALVISILTEEKVRKRRSKQPTFLRAALARPLNGRHSTAWRILLTFGTPRDFIKSTNFPKQVIVERILPKFERARARFNYGSPYRKGPKERGREPQVDSMDLVGLALWYLKTRGTMYSLCPVFGLVPTTISVWLDYALEVLLRVVNKKRHKDFGIRWPNVDEMKLSAELLQRNRPHGHFLGGVFGVVDGGRMPCAHYVDSNLQNAFFEGFTQNEEITNLLVFNFFGELIHAAINFPGSWHDNRLASASGLYWPMLSDDMTPPGYAILGDSAFIKDTRVTNGKIIRSRKANETQDIPESAELCAVDMILQRIMPGERQSAEWGIRALKGPFARLKLPLPADASKRSRLVRICCHLLNLRTRVVGLNQIRSTYAGPGALSSPSII